MVSHADHTLACYAINLSCNVVAAVVVSTQVHWLTDSSVDSFVMYVLFVADKDYMLIVIQNPSEWLVWCEGRLLWNVLFNETKQTKSLTFFVGCWCFFYVILNAQHSLLTLGHWLFSFFTSLHIELYPHYNRDQYGMLYVNNFVDLLLHLY